MDKAIAIFEENHGLLAVASNYQRAVMWLINNRWLTGCTEVMDDSTHEWIFLKEACEEDWIDYISTRLDIHDFNEYFEGSFLLQEIEVF